MNKGIEANKTLLSEFKALYSDLGFHLQFKDADEEDALVNWNRTGVIVKPYTKAIFNYVIAGKHKQQFNTRPVIFYS